MVVDMEVKKRLDSVHKNSGILYQGLALLDEVGEVTGQCTAEKSFRSSPQADSSPVKSANADGSDGTFQKVPLVNQEKSKIESFPKVPSLPSVLSGFEQGKNAVNRTEKTYEPIQKG